MSDGTTTLSAIHSLNALAHEHEVFLCNAQPWRCDPMMVAAVPERATLLEGTLSVSAWSEGSVGDAEDGRLLNRRRIDVLRELINFHRIDVVRSCSSRADRLMLEVIEGLDVSWFNHVDECRETLDLSGLKKGPHLRLSVNAQRSSPARCRYA